MAKSKIPTCIDCNVPVKMFYVESEEQSIDLDGSDPQTTEDSYSVSEVEFRCPECGEPVKLSNKELQAFIKWGDENLSEVLWRTWERYIKPYLVYKYETIAE